MLARRGRRGSILFKGCVSDRPSSRTSSPARGPTSNDTSSSARASTLLSIWRSSRCSNAAGDRAALRVDRRVRPQPRGADGRRPDHGRHHPCPRGSRGSSACAPSTPSAPRTARVANSGVASSCNRASACSCGRHHVHRRVPSRRRSTRCNACGAEVVGVGVLVDARPVRRPSAACRSSRSGTSRSPRIRPRTARNARAASRW